MKDNFIITGGSVIGRLHQEKGINNQDAFQWSQSDTYSIAVVTDGCTGETATGFQDPEVKNSEVGAHIGALLCIKTIERLLPKFEKVFGNSSYLQQDTFWMEVRADLLAQLRVLGNTLHDNLFKVMKNYFQFTIVGTIITPEKTCIFSLGDGWYEVNGITHEIMPDEGYKQPYLAYGITGCDLNVIDRESLQFKVHECIETNNVHHLGIATDGIHFLQKNALSHLPGKSQKIKDASQFWTEEKYKRNPFALQNRLQAIHTPKQRIMWSEGKVDKFQSVLKDDTTIVFVHNKNYKDEDRILQG